MIYKIPSNINFFLNLKKYARLKIIIFAWFIWSAFPCKTHFAALITWAKSELSESIPKPLVVIWISNET